MKKILAALRLPSFLAGPALLFVADRYLGAENYHTGLRFAAFGLCALGMLMTFMLALSAKTSGLANEAKGWRSLLVWQLLVTAGLGAYLG